MSSKLARFHIKIFFLQNQDTKYAIENIADNAQLVRKRNGILGSGNINLECE